MRDDTKPFLVSRRVAKSKVEVKEATSILKKLAISFLNNNGTLLSSYFYSQFKNWYFNMPILFAERTEATQE